MISNNVSRSTGSSRESFPSIYSDGSSGESHRQSEYPGGPGSSGIFERKKIQTLAAERDISQKQTFTKWINSFLADYGYQIQDLFHDFRDGRILLKLLEILSGERLPEATRGHTRIHCLENVSKALDFLSKQQGVHIENIGPHDVVDGNQRLTLGLVWAIILRFQYQHIIMETLEKTDISRVSEQQLANFSSELHALISNNFRSQNSCTSLSSLSQSLNYEIKSLTTKWLSVPGSKDGSTPNSLDARSLSSDSIRSELASIGNTEFFKKKRDIVVKTKRLKRSSTDASLLILKRLSLGDPDNDGAFFEVRKAELPSEMHAAISKHLPTQDSLTSFDNAEFSHHRVKKALTRRWSSPNCVSHKISLGHRSLSLEEISSSNQFYCSKQSKSTKDQISNYEYLNLAAINSSPNSALIDQDHDDMSENEDEDEKTVYSISHQSTLRNQQPQYLSTATSDSSNSLSIRNKVLHSSDTISTESRQVLSEELLNVNGLISENSYSCNVFNRNECTETKDKEVFSNLNLVKKSDNLKPMGNDSFSKIGNSVSFESNSSVPLVKTPPVPNNFLSQDLSFSQASSCRSIFIRRWSLPNIYGDIRKGLPQIKSLSFERIQSTSDLFSVKPSISIQIGSNSTISEHKKPAESVQTLESLENRYTISTYKEGVHIIEKSNIGTWSHDNSSTYLNHSYNPCIEGSKAFIESELSLFEADKNLSEKPSSTFNMVTVQSAKVNSFISNIEEEQEKISRQQKAEESLRDQSLSLKIQPPERVDINLNSLAVDRNQILESQPELSLHNFLTTGTNAKSSVNPELQSKKCESLSTFELDNFEAPLITKNQVLSGTQIPNGSPSSTTINFEKSKQEILDINKEKIIINGAFSYMDPHQPMHFTLQPFQKQDFSFSLPLSSRNSSPLDSNVSISSIQLPDFECEPPKIEKDFSLSSPDKSIETTYDVDSSKRVEICIKAARNCIESEDCLTSISTASERDELSEKLSVTVDLAECNFAVSNHVAKQTSSMSMGGDSHYLQDKKEKFLSPNEVLDMQNSLPLDSSVRSEANMLQTSLDFDRDFKRKKDFSEGTPSEQKFNNIPVVNIEKSTDIESATSSNTDNAHYSSKFNAPFISYFLEQDSLPSFSPLLYPLNRKGRWASSRWLKSPPTHWDLIKPQSQYSQSLSSECIRSSSFTFKSNADQNRVVKDPLVQRTARNASSIVETLDKMGIRATSSETRLAQFYPELQESILSKFPPQNSSGSLTNSFNYRLSFGSRSPSPELNPIKNPGCLKNLQNFQDLESSDTSSIAARKSLNDLSKLRKEKVEKQKRNRNLKILSADTHSMNMRSLGKVKTKGTASVSHNYQLPSSFRDSIYSKWLLEGTALETSTPKKGKLHHKRRWSLPADERDSAKKCITVQSLKLKSVPSAAAMNFTGKFERRKQDKALKSRSFDRSDAPLLVSLTIDLNANELQSHSSRKTMSAPPTPQRFVTRRRKRRILTTLFEGLRTSFPISFLILLLVGVSTLVPSLEDDFECVLLNNFRTSFGATLDYPTGPPPL